MNELFILIVGAAVGAFAYRWYAKRQ